MRLPLTPSLLRRVLALAMLLGLAILTFYPDSWLSSHFATVLLVYIALSLILAFEPDPPPPNEGKILMIRAYRLVTLLVALIIVGGARPEMFTLPAVLILGLCGLFLLALDAHELGLTKRKEPGP